MDAKVVGAATTAMIGGIVGAATVANVEGDSNWQRVGVAVLIAAAVVAFGVIAYQVRKWVVSTPQSWRKVKKATAGGPTIPRRDVEASRRVLRGTNTETTRHTALNKLQEENINRSRMQAHRDQLQRFLDRGEEMRRRTPMNASVVGMYGKMPLTQEELQEWVREIEDLLSTEPRQLSQFRLPPDFRVTKFALAMDPLASELEYHLNQLEDMIRNG